MGQREFSTRVENRTETLTINREEALNGLNLQLVRDMKDEFIRVKADNLIKVLIITGQGSKSFCAGADIKELLGRSIDQEKHDIFFGHETFSILENMGKPTIAAINGYALGGGLEMALACTFRIASPNARLGLTETNLGIIPGYGGTQRLSRLIGPKKALRMILLGKRLSAEEAMQIDLIDDVVEADKLMDKCMELAQNLSSRSATASALAMESVLGGFEMNIKDGLLLEANLAILALHTEGAEEGIKAFLEKRKPDFKDK
ncbi:MAG: enoyl-CoA hydratase/isomerase family protein [Proteobacteria bacterium]|nr:enoyl-CoA hydratase/isomerase family protein [Pseudomonadota bacterium]